MGCFSFMCKECGKAILSNSFSGQNVKLFLLEKGKIVEQLEGQYDSYGCVFDENMDSRKWSLPWSGSTGTGTSVCNLMFSDDESTGMAAIHSKCYIKDPTTRSADDPNQGWGEYDELMGDTDASRDFNGDSLDYIAEVVALKSPDFKLPDNPDLVHAIVGISTETGELIEQLEMSMFDEELLDIINVKEELGDLMWYMALMCHVLDITFDDIETKADTVKTMVTETRLNSVIKDPLITRGILGIGRCSGTIMDQLKRATYYQQDPDIGILMHNLKIILWFIKIMCEELGTTVAALQDMNMEKLHKRYKTGKFSVKDCIDRDTDSERKILEG